MLTTFIHPDVYTVKPFSPVWINLEGKIKRDLINVTGYYRNIEKTVPNSHLLVTIIKKLRVDITVGVTVYKDAVYEKAFYGLNTTDIVTYSSRGKFMYDEIHVDTINYIKSNNFKYNLFALEDNWKDAVPLVVVGHDMLDVSMNHPENNTSLGEVFYELDPVLLLLQYKYWALERLKFNLTTDPRVFVYTYVLTNTIPSFLDMSIVNISLSELPVVEFTPVHKFHLMDLTLDYKKLSMYMNKHYTSNRSSTKIEAILNSIRLITHSTALEFLKINNLSTRMNIKWFHYLSHYSVIDKLIDIEHGKSGNMNRKAFTVLKSNINKDKNTGTIRNMFPSNADKMFDMLNKLKDKR